MDLLAQKNSIRLAMIEKRSLLSDGFISSAGKKIAQQVLGLPEVSNALRVGIYAEYRKEVSTQELYLKLRLGSRILYFPRVVKEKLMFVPIESEQQLVRGYSGILEPEPQMTGEEVDRLEVVVVPGVAFDENGGRIGWGKGYYDKTLAGFSGIRVGLAYDFQVVESIPATKHDQKVDMVVTEKRIIRCHQD